MEYIGFILIPILLIDVFYILYNLYCKLLLKRLKITEKGLIEQGLEIDEIDIDSVKDIKVFISYIVSTLLGILSVFFCPEFYGEIFFENLKTEIFIILGIFLFFLSFYTIIQRILYYVGYGKGFLKGLKDSKEIIEDKSDNIEDNN